MDRGAWWATVIEVAESDTAEQLHFKLLCHSFFFSPFSSKRNYITPNGQNLFR